MTEKHPLKSRKGIYILKNNFYRFWFKFIFPNTEDIERKRQDYLLTAKIMPELDRFTSLAFEEICKEWLWKLTLFNYDKIGRWWEKEEEIDIVAVNDSEKRILFAECKWQEKVDAERVLHELRSKAKAVEWNTNRTESYAIFAKSCIRKIRHDNVHIFALRDLKNYLNPSLP